MSPTRRRTAAGRPRGAPAWRCARPKRAATAALDGERRDVLLAAVERLSADHRDVVACRFFLGLSEEETATALGLRKGTVKSRLARALERLRGELGEDDV